jgi:hypothetical protein
MRLFEVASINRYRRASYIVNVLEVLGSTAHTPVEPVTIINLVKVSADDVLAKLNA